MRGPRMGVCLLLFSRGEDLQRAAVTVRDVWKLKTAAPCSALIANGYIDRTSAVQNGIATVPSWGGQRPKVDRPAGRTLHFGLFCHFLAHRRLRCQGTARCSQPWYAQGAIELRAGFSCGDRSAKPLSDASRACRMRSHPVRSMRPSGALAVSTDASRYAAIRGDGLGTGSPFK